MIRTAGIAVALAVLAGCTSTSSGRPETSGSLPTAPPTASSSQPSTVTSPSSSITQTRSTSPGPPPDRAHQLLAAMTLTQRVGQLFMVDCPTSVIAASTVRAIQQFAVGSVILDGTSYAPSSAIATLTAGLERANPSAAKLFIATDQEGGQVQRLRGPGFSPVPSAVQQGTMAPAQLRTQARTWGQQLRAAGVNVDLAPVLDTVPANSAGNPPIGDLDREYGRDPASVTAHGLAVLDGLDASVAATVKHFPGLGRVSGNTDLASGVTDTVTTRTDPYLAPFTAAIRDNVPFVMMSTAIYARIDAKNPAAFSPTIVTGMLRRSLQFRGVIISDDLGQAAQVGNYSIGDRAVAFIAAGGDMVLTVDATQTAAMTGAVLTRARTDSAFRGLVNAAALRVLETKDRYGLLD